MSRGERPVFLGVGGGLDGPFRGLASAFVVRVCGVGAIFLFVAGAVPQKVR